MLCPCWEASAVGSVSTTENVIDLLKYFSNLGDHLTCQGVNFCQQLLDDEELQHGGGGGENRESLALS